MDTLSLEPEELVEARLCAILANALTIPVGGIMTPMSQGSAKDIATDTFASVIVDQVSQTHDCAGDGTIATYSARIIVHYAFADDKTCTAFRDECRRARAALRALTGDGCTELSTEGAFACDGFILDSTSTDFEGGDNPLNSKTYSATVHGRTINQTTQGD